MTMSKAQETAPGTIRARVSTDKRLTRSRRLSTAKGNKTSLLYTIDFETGRLELGRRWLALEDVPMFARLLTGDVERNLSGFTERRPERAPPAHGPSGFLTRHINLLSPLAADLDVRPAPMWLRLMTLFRVRWVIVREAA